MNIHEKFINRCIQIAENTLGISAPNPMVGCVIVHNNSIIAEGVTSAYGGPHAEVNAINAVPDKSILKEATLYVTLEPCSHHGKTPPCADLIIKYEIPNVVIGCVDDNPEVSGKGIEKLEQAGYNVDVGVLEHACKWHHRRFFTFHNKKRPYIILKWAQTSEGFMAPLEQPDQRPVWLSNKYSRQLVHKWRSEEQAILVGTNTVLKDNPKLDVRHYKGRNPIRVVIDREEKLSGEFNIFNKAARTIRLSKNNIDFNRPLAQEICSFLYNEKINSLIVEGGQQTLQTFIDEGIWDEARIFTGHSSFVKSGIKAPVAEGKCIEERMILKDQLKIIVND